MAEEVYLYGVFARASAVKESLRELTEAGYKEAQMNVVGKNCPEFKHVSASIVNPVKRYFVYFGTVGAIGGMIGGVVLAPTISYVPSFQVMTTVMGSVSLAIVMAYIGEFLAAFIHANEPQYYANLYQAEINGGDFLVSLEVEKGEDTSKAWSILADRGAREIIMRRMPLGEVIGVPALEREPEAAKEAVPLTVAA